MSNNKIRLALAQLNLKVGDITGNTVQIINAIKQARDNLRAHIIIFPELSITSYPPEDLLLRSALYESVEHSLQQILTTSYDIDVVLGYPEKNNGRPFNTCSLLRNGHIHSTYRKQNLPNYSVFDEKRYFEPGQSACITETNGVKAALSICEDIWVPEPISQASKGGAALLFNINASPYHSDKLYDREEIVQSRAKESNIHIVYVNLVGGQDELVFDGGSMVVDKQGQLAFRAPQFEAGVYIVELDKDQDTFTTPVETQISSPGRLNNIYQALVLGVRDYVTKNHFKGAIIGLSGGIDSALTLCIAADALGNENVEAFIMPSRYTATMSIEDAKQQAETLGVSHYIISIEEPFSAFNHVLDPVFSNLPEDTTEENIQARCRGTLLMAVSNKTGKLVLATGNKSEMAVGYATLYGDMAGGFAPLKDVPKTLVFQLANWRNTQGQVIPQRVIDRPPSAELKPDQVDEDSLPPYDILDVILEQYIEADRSPGEIINAGFDSETVKKVVRMVDRNEYKRRQAAPGVRISQRAFGRDRRYPITSGYNEYDLP
ncbi:MAG: NAD+ synthase [Gammaproteobacteria bacterium]